MRKIYNGFTLIELLFVIAIIGVLASLGVSMAEKKAEEFKIKKAALQVQYVLEAGLSYYADNKKWPNDGWSQKPRGDVPAGPNNCTDAPDTYTEFRNFCDNYIGSGHKNIGPALRNDPWGVQPYFWRTLSTGGSYTTGRFTVQVKTPNVNIAQRLAALLPSGAYCKPNGTMNWDCVPNADPGHLWVRAYANIPGQAQPSDRITIQDVGHTDRIASKSKPTCSKVYPVSISCPSGQEGDIIVDINHIYRKMSQEFISFAKTNIWIKYITNDKYTDNKYYDTDGSLPHCTQLVTDGPFVCDFKLCVQGGPQIAARASYIGVCKPKK